MLQFLDVDLDWIDFSKPPEAPWWKDPKVSTAVFGAGLYTAFRMFKWHPVFTIGVSVIPVSKWLEERTRLTPILSKLVSLGLFTGFMIVSWWVAEIAVICAGVGILMEFWDICEIIARWIEREDRNERTKDTEEAARRLKAQYAKRRGKRPSATSS